jgi:hypothetical protein
LLDHMGRGGAKAILRVALLNNPKCGIPRLVRGWGG